MEAAKNALTAKIKTLSNVSIDSQRETPSINLEDALSKDGVPVDLDEYSSLETGHARRNDCLIYALLPILIDHFLSYDDGTQNKVADYFRREYLPAILNKADLDKKEWSAKLPHMSLRQILRSINLLDDGVLKLLSTLWKVNFVVIGYDTTNNWVESFTPITFENRTGDNESTHEYYAILNKINYHFEAMRPLTIPAEKVASITSNIFTNIDETCANKMQRGHLIRTKHPLLPNNVFTINTVENKGIKAPCDLISINETSQIPNDVYTEYYNKNILPVLLENPNNIDNFGYTLKSGLQFKYILADHVDLINDIEQEPVLPKPAPTQPPAETPEAPIPTVLPPDAPIPTEPLVDPQTQTPEPEPEAVLPPTQTPPPEPEPTQTPPEPTQTPPEPTQTPPPEPEPTQTPPEPTQTPPPEPEPTQTPPEPTQTPPPEPILTSLPLQTSEESTDEDSEEETEEDSEEDSEEGSEEIKDNEDSETTKTSDSIEGLTTKINAVLHEYIPDGGIIVEGDKFIQHIKKIDTTRIYELFQEHLFEEIPKKTGGTKRTAPLPIRNRTLRTHPFRSLLS